MRRLLFLLVGVSLSIAIVAASAAASAEPLRPMKGSCTTTFAISGFDQQHGAPVAHILGLCRFTHLGATTYEAWQLLYPDGTIVNDGTYTAADGDQLYTHVVGTGIPDSATTIALHYGEWYTGGTGRFADVVTTPLTGLPAVTGSGEADLVAGTGWFVSSGMIGY